MSTQLTGLGVGRRPGALVAPNAFRRPAQYGHLRDVPPRMAASLLDEVLQLCLCVRVDTRDGASLGFTTHDDDVVFGGITYEASSAVQATNIRQEVGGSPDNVDVSGVASYDVLSSDAITDEDLRAGRYDDASVTITLVDWGDTAAGGIVLMRGNIGDVTLADGVYTAGLRSLMQRMQQQVGELYAPACRVFRLGDAQCKFDLSGNTVGGHPARSTVTVASVAEPRIFELSGAVTEVGYYNYGTLRAVGGRNDGYEREVKLHGEGDGFETRVIAVPGVPTGALAFRTSYDFTPSFTADVPVPVGVWEMASLAVTSSWSVLDPLQDGTDTLDVQFPVGMLDDQPLRSNSANSAVYNDAVQLGTRIVTLINSATGGTIPFGLRHTQPSSDDRHYHDVSVSSASLVLVGPGGGTSSRVVLHESFPYPVSPGDVFVATTGCNRLPGTCRQKFANVINIRCEPHLPGTDKLLARGRPPS